MLLVHRGKSKGRKYICRRCHAQHQSNVYPFPCTECGYKHHVRRASPKADRLGLEWDNNKTVHLIDKQAGQHEKIKW